MSKRYIVSTDDTRDGGKHRLNVLLEDDDTGARSELLIAMFEPKFKGAAEKYAAWMNGAIEDTAKKGATNETR